MMVVDYLRATGQLPAIHFIFSRRQCDQAAQACVRSGVRLVSRDQVTTSLAIAERRLAGIAKADLHALGYGDFVEQLRVGVASHHAGMIPAFREIVETCFIEGSLRLVYATETLAVGVNMPARSVVIDTLTKFNGTGHELLTPAQYTQLAGRAGRRGIDERGAVVSLWSPFVRFEDAARLAAASTFDLRSAFKPTYNMAANLVGRFDRRQAINFLGLSFAQFQADRNVVALERRLGRLRAEYADARSSAESPYGDVADFYSKGSGGAETPDNQLQAVLGALKPGDVVPVNVGKFKGPAAVVATAHRKQGVQTTLVTASAKEVKIPPTGWPHLPVVVARVVLPGAYAPNRRGYREDVAQRIKDATVATSMLSRGVDGVEGAVMAPPAKDSSPRSVTGTDEGDRHPALDDPDLSDRLEALERARSLESQIERLARRAEHRDGALAKDFDRVLDVLEDLGCFDRARWSLTSAGAGVARLFHENDLLICRALDRGVFDDLDPASFAALSSVFVYEHRSPEPPASPRFPHRQLGEAWEQIVSLSGEQARAERRRRHQEHRQPDPTVVGPVYRWASGSSLDSVLDESIAGGDFVRLMRQIADVIEQIGSVASEPSTRANASRAAAQIYRDVVADTAPHELERHREGSDVG